MNESSRIIPSIICHLNHRDFGENSKSFLKQNLNTSYNNFQKAIWVNPSAVYAELLSCFQMNPRQVFGAKKIVPHDKLQSSQIIEH